MNELLAKYIINQYPPKYYYKMIQDVKLQDVNNTPYFTRIFANELNQFKAELTNYSNVHINRAQIESYVLKHAYLKYNYETMERVIEFKRHTNKSNYTLASNFRVSRQNLDSLINGDLEKLSLKVLFRMNLYMDQMT